MRRWSLIVIAASVVIGAVVVFLPRFRPEKTLARPRPVPEGDREIAWLHNPTSFETWENFVWGVKRTEMVGDGGPDGLEVDDSAAFPEKTTAVPEVVIRRRGFLGALRIRWYKVTDTAMQEDWVKAFARSNHPPLAIIGGWSSDRAKELADAMRNVNWSGARPLLFLSTATADKVDPDDEDIARGDLNPSLIALYDRSFRFCFTNRQMADAVMDFVFSDPTLRPGLPVWPGYRAVLAGASGGWAALAALPNEPIPGYAIEWKDDPYSTDLSFKFREALRTRAGPGACLPRLDVIAYSVPFSTGRLNHPNPAEAQVAEHILSNLPPPGNRSVLMIPTVTPPARRTLRSLVQGNPAVGRQLVAVTGDGMSVNTFFRDRESAWPVRSIPVPLVLFTHADPFGWDNPGEGATPPRGYELTPPQPGAVRSSTEDIRHYTRLARVVSAAAFPDAMTTVAESPDMVAHRLRNQRPAFFDVAGNRLDGTGEYVVVLRPAFQMETHGAQRQLDGTIDVYTRELGGAGWRRVHSRPLMRSEGGERE